MCTQLFLNLFLSHSECIHRHTDSHTHWNAHICANSHKNTLKFFLRFEAPENIHCIFHPLSIRSSYLEIILCLLHLKIYASIYNKWYIYIHVLFHHTVRGIFSIHMWLSWFLMWTLQLWLMHLRVDNMWSLTQLPGHCLLCLIVNHSLSLAPSVDIPFLALQQQWPSFFSRNVLY